MNRKTKMIVSTVFGMAAVASVAWAANIVSRTVDFESASGTGPQEGWTYRMIDPDKETIETGPNGNKYFQVDIDNWGVTLFSTYDGTNEWVGNKDYRAEGVVGFSFTAGGTADFTTARKPTVFIMTDNGTPDDRFDDYGYYRSSNKFLIFDGRKTTFEFKIGSGKMGVEPPNGWVAYAVNDEIPKDISWDKVITDVDRMDIGFWRPDFFYVFQNHEVGVDNLTIYADLDRR